MSCKSLTAARAFEADKDMTHCGGFQRSVRFSSSSESRGSARASRNDGHIKRDNSSGSLSQLPISAPINTEHNAMSQSVPTHCVLEDTPPPPASCRFPKLEECAHFHYERVCLGSISIELTDCEVEEGENWEKEGWICLKVKSHVSSTADENEIKNLSTSWTEASEVKEWSLTRDAHNFLQLDDMLHRCIYDRKVSGLIDLSSAITESLLEDRQAYSRLISSYVHHLSIIADDSINCASILNWLQMDNKGHKLLVSNEDSSSINTPAVAAAYSVRKYVSQARDEISFEVGDMISIIDMPGPQESTWWRGKRGFKVGFFPQHCVAVIGDKVPRNMTQPPPCVGSVAVHQIKPVLRRHGKLISLFRSFILSRPSRRTLKQQGILKERVFGCDLGEHLLNEGLEVPLVLTSCATEIERRGAIDGIYRLSGGSGLTSKLRGHLDLGLHVDFTDVTDNHVAPSLLKMYFRELPNPLCTYQLYDSFVSAVAAAPEERLARMRNVVVKLPPPHYRTLKYLALHLHRMSGLHAATGMTARNLAIVWAPNLLRSPASQHALRGVAVQAVVTEFLIVYAEELFNYEQGSEPELEPEIEETKVRDSMRRPKSLPIPSTTKLLSLEEARRRGQTNSQTQTEADIDISRLRPSMEHPPKYIEVGSGPNNLPQYHTVLELPLSGGKRGLKRSPSGWRGLFSRTKQRPPITPVPCGTQDTIMATTLRPAKSCESLQSETDTLAPLAETMNQPLKQHTRSASCDSYFEPWQAELADMRLRLAPQERDRYIFSEEDDTILQQQFGLQGGSVSSSPLASELCSVEPSPRRSGREDERKRTMLEEQISELRYIDGGDSPKDKAAEKRHSDSNQVPGGDLPKRVCKDRDSPISSISDFQAANMPVKMRERNSPRKARNSSRYSNLHQFNNPPDLENILNSRLSWHGKDGHSTLIKVDWPNNSSTSTIMDTPLTPVTPNYEVLESDSDETNKHTIKISSKNCSCDDKCLKCELKAVYDNARVESKSGESSTEFGLRDSLEHSPTNITYKNLNRLSATSNSSSEPNSDKKNYENLNRKSVMTSSHESSSTYSNPSKNDDLYECFSLARPNYINLKSCSSKSSPTSPLKSTISITFRSPSKSPRSIDYDFMPNIETPVNERDSVYEDIDLEKCLSIVEDASVPNIDASLPSQEACQPENVDEELIILESPQNDKDVYNQVKFFKKSIDEVNAMILETPKDEPRYENMMFPIQRDSSSDYENINVDALKICDDRLQRTNDISVDNGNVVTVQSNLNVRELANKFESPTELKGPIFEKFKAEIKYPTLEKKDSKNIATKDLKETTKVKSHRNSRSLDENAFILEFGETKCDINIEKDPTDLNLNTDTKQEVVTPTSENKISLIQRFEKPDIKNLLGDAEKSLSRERIERYKEERRNFLREKYSSQSFRSNPEHLTKIKIKKETEIPPEPVVEELPKFERRNTVDLGQRLRFSLAKSREDIDITGDEKSPEPEFSIAKSERDCERIERVSPSYNIRDMAAMFEQKSQSNGTG